jgi:energy-coupling factor transport system ATP-binding protein
MKYHRSQNSTILLITHSMEDIAQLADRLVVFSDGRIVMDGRQRIFFHGPTS